MIRAAVSGVPRSRTLSGARARPNWFEFRSLLEAGGTDLVVGSQIEEFRSVARPPRLYASAN